MMNKPFSLYVDDERTPKGLGWTVVRTYDEAVKRLSEGWDNCLELSVDHDLGTEKTGYDLAKWIENEIELSGRPPIPHMACHSANPAGKKNIMMVFDKYN
jgi:hypothetical protein